MTTVSQEISFRSTIDFALILPLYAKLIMYPALLVPDLSSTQSALEYPLLYGHFFPTTKTTPLQITV